MVLISGDKTSRLQQTSNENRNETVQSLDRLLMRRTSLLLDQPLFSAPTVLTNLGKSLDHSSPTRLIHNLRREERQDTA